MSQPGGCPQVGQTVEVGSASPHMWGDLDCSGTLDSLDPLRLLWGLAGLATDPIADCPDVGDAVTISV